MGILIRKKQEVVGLSDGGGLNMTVSPLRWDYWKLWLSFISASHQDNIKSEQLKPLSQTGLYSGRSGIFCIN